MTKQKTATDRRLLRRIGVTALIVLLAIVAWKMNQDGTDGWPPIASLRGLDGSELVLAAGQNLRVKSRNDPELLSSVQLPILGVLPVLGPLVGPEAILNMAAIDPETKRSPGLDMLEHGLEVLGAKRSQEVLQRSVRPLAGRRQIEDATSARVNKEFHDAWTADGVESLAAEYIRAHAEEFR